MKLHAECKITTTAHDIVAWFPYQSIFSPKIHIFHENFITMWNLRLTTNFKVGTYKSNFHAINKVLQWHSIDGRNSSKMNLSFTASHILIIHQYLQQKIYCILHIPRNCIIKIVEANFFSSFLISFKLLLKGGILVKYKNEKLKGINFQIVLYLSFLDM